MILSESQVKKIKLLRACRKGVYEELCNTIDYYRNETRRLTEINKRLMDMLDQHCMGYLKGDKG